MSWDYEVAAVALKIEVILERAPEICRQCLNRDLFLDPIRSQVTPYPILD